MPSFRKGLQNVFCAVFSEANVVLRAYGKTTNSRLAEELACLFKFLKCVTVITAAEQHLSCVYFCVQ